MSICKILTAAFSVCFRILIFVFLFLAFTQTALAEIFIVNEPKTYSWSTRTNGGAMGLNASTGIFNFAVIFQSNRANSRDGKGGAIFAVGAAKLVFNSNVDFISNNSQHDYDGELVGGAAYGGAIFADAKTEINFNGAANFSNNKAIGDIGRENSSAGGPGGYAYGGAFFLSNAGIIKFNGSAKFLSNRVDGGRGGTGIGLGEGGIGVAGHGGAFYIAASKDIIFNGAVDFIDNTVNGGNGGGGLGGGDIDGRGGDGASGYGGAIFITNASKMVFNGLASFLSNKAKGGEGGWGDGRNSWIGYGGNGADGYGGAIYIEGASILDFRGGANISNNSTLIGAGGKPGHDGRGKIGRPGNAYGGAVYANGGKLYFGGAHTVISTNSAPNQGGAFYAINSSIIKFLGDKVEIKYNHAAQGAAFYAVNSTIIIFDSQEAEISYNSSGGGAAFFLTNKSTLSFTGQNISLNYNNSQNANGNIYIQNATIDSAFSNTLTAAKNTAANGGLLFADSSSIINFSNVRLDENTASNAGGAIYSNSANIAFNELTDIKNNHASYGGAMFLAGKSKTIFRGLENNFIGNTSTREGGAFYLTDNAAVEIYGGITNLSFNSSKDTIGGAVYAIGSSSIMAKGGNLIFEGNKSKEGGAVRADNSARIVFNVYDGKFISNQANFGGAIYAKNTAFINIDNMDFSQNIAHSSGGAIYVNGAGKDAIVKINAISKNVVFYENSAGGRPNDIFADGNSNIVFNAASARQIILNGGIIAMAQTSLIKTGAGNLLLGGNTKILGAAHVKEGRMIMHASSIAIAKVNIEKGGVFSTNIDGNLQKNIIYVNKLNIDGALEITFDNYYEIADKIIGLEKNAVALTTASTLIIKSRGIGQIQTTIIQGNAIGGKFSKVIRDSNVKTEIRYLDNSEIEIITHRWSDFEGMDGNRKNQNTVGSILDGVSRNFRTMSPKMQTMIDRIDRLPTTLEKQKALDHLSGSFIANVLSEQNSSKNNSIIFNRLSLYSKDPRAAAWAFFEMGKSVRTLDQNSYASEFNNKKYGGVFGYDIWESKTKSALVGAFGVYDYNLSYAGPDSGDIANYEIGGYALKNFKALNFIGNLALGHQEYRLTRDISIGALSYTPRSYFTSKTLKISAQTEYALPLKYKITLKPFVGLMSNLIYNESFEEANGGIAELEFDAMYNYKLEGAVGIKLENKIEKFIWNFTAYAAPVLSGQATKTKAKIINAGDDAAREISNNSEYLYGAFEAGLMYLISQNFTAFINADMQCGEFRNSFSYGAGLSYKFKSLSQEDIILDVYEKADSLIDERKYLKATDILNDILKSNSEYEPAKDALEKIAKQMAKESADDNGLNYSQMTYAKGYIAYHQNDFETALAEWNKFMEVASDKRDVSEYLDKCGKILKDKANAKYEQRAKKILDDGIALFQKARWVECIKAMEALQNYIAKNKFKDSKNYNAKAKHYIALCVDELSKLGASSAQSEDSGAKENGAPQKSNNIDEAQEKYNEGLELYASGKYLEAQRVWEQALRLNPNHTRAKVALSNLKKENK